MTLLSVSPLPVQGNRQKKTKTTLTSRRKRKVYFKIRFRRRRTHTPASPSEFHPAQTCCLRCLTFPRDFFSPFSSTQKSRNHPIDGSLLCLLLRNVTPPHQIQSNPPTKDGKIVHKHTHSRHWGPMVRQIDENNSKL